MRNTLATLAALLILFGGLGAARNWYTVEGQPAETGRFAFRVEFDAIKVGSDVTDALRWIHNKVSRAPEEQPEADESKETKEAKEAKKEK